jgi:hypothetical protein
MEARMRSVLTAVVVAALASLAPGLAETTTSMVVPVVAVDNPQQLLSLDVVDPSGGPIGKVVNVRTGSDGKISRVMVMLVTPEGMGRVAAIRPERLSFDRRELKLVGDYSAAQLTQLAETATTPKGMDTSRSSGMVQRPDPGGPGGGIPGGSPLPMGR